MNQEYEGVPTRSLLGAFFAVVLLCAVFFALGFFLGNRQGRAGNEPVTEQVPPSFDVPQAVNLPASNSQPSAESQGSGDNRPVSDQNAAGASAAGPSTAPSVSSSPPPPGAEAAKLSTETVSSPASGAAAVSQPAPAAKGSSAAAERIPPGLLVQVAALSNRQDAINMVNVLKSRGYPALILTPAQANADDTLFRVAVGPYKTRSEADRARTLLAAGGFKPFIRE